MQAAAANREIAAAESKNMIEFLRLAQDSSVVSEGEMREMFVSARKCIFGEKTNDETNKEKEPELVFDDN